METSLGRVENKSKMAGRIQSTQIDREAERHHWLREKACRRTWVVGIGSISVVQMGQEWLLRKPSQRKERKESR